MAVTANSVISPQAPKVYTASINNGDASAWKLLRDNAFLGAGGGAVGGAGSGTTGSKFTSIVATSTDTTARNVQLAIARSVSCTVTSVSPGVVTISAGSNIANGDQVIFSAATMPTGLTAGTTYFAVSASPGSSATFSVAATFGGTAINTSSTGTTVIVYVIRILTTIPVAITAGTDGATASGYFLNTTYWPGVPVDNDGNPYLFLESNDFLAGSCTGTVTSGKIINLSAIGANF